MSNDCSDLCNRMIHEQLLRRGIRNDRVLEAMKRVPRHEFVPENLVERAYEDGPLPIGFGQTISQPYIVAYMSEVLDVREGAKVLEIGTGSAYQTAVLANLAKEVFSVERIPELFDIAKFRLAGMKYSNIHLKCAEGQLGWKEESPFDRIMITAAPEESVPSDLVSQLAEGGKLIAPLGKRDQELIIGIKRGAELDVRRLIPVKFVPLIGK